MSSLLAFNRVNRLEIQPVMLVLSTGFVNYCPFDLLSVMSKMKRQTFLIALETKPKRSRIVPEFVLLKTDCFDLVQHLLSWTKKK